MVTNFKFRAVSHVYVMPKVELQRHVHNSARTRVTLTKRYICGSLEGALAHYASSDL
jgi:hypothetical protein